MAITARSNTWCAIVNVYAASNTAICRWEEARARLDTDGVRYQAVFTGTDGNASELTAAACANGYRQFIAVGGDGTVHDVLQGIMSYVNDPAFSDQSLKISDFTLGVIPLGSGNDWIKTSGIPRDLQEAASLFKHGRIARQDVVRVSLLDNGLDAREVRYMVNVGGVGLDARVCVKVNRAKCQGKKGKMLYVTALVDCILHRTPASACVLCDGCKIYEGGFLSMSFGIGKYSGGGMRQTPAAVIDDGLLDMTLIPDLPLLKLAKEAPKLFTGKLLDVPELVTSRARTIEIMPAKGCSEGSEPVEVDGEVVGNSPVRFEILEDQLNIVVPL